MFGCLEILLGLLPLDVRAVALATAVRLRLNDVWYKRGSFGGYSAIWNQWPGLDDSLATVDTMPKRYKLNGSFGVHIPR